MFMIESLVMDVRVAVRWLLKRPGFTLSAVFSLAIGTGFSTAIFAIVDAALFKPPPVAGPDRLVYVYTTTRAGATGSDRFGTSSYPDYLDLKAGNAVFEDLIGYTPMFTPLNLGSRSTLTVGEVVTGNYFRVLGVGAALGRTLLPEDDVPGAPHVALVSYRYWVRELAQIASTAAASAGCS